jgi:hypothetical protein
MGCIRCAKNAAMKITYDVLGVFVFKRGGIISRTRKKFIGRTGSG